MSLPRAAALVLAGVVGLGSIAHAVGREARSTHDHASHRHGPAPTVLGGSWAYRPAGLAELAARTPAVVVAEVTGVRAGAPLQPPAGTPDAATAAIPTQRIAVRVTGVLRGDAPRELELFRTGDAASGLDGDPAYAVGERYVLFLRPRLGGDGTYLPVAPDGRLALDGDRLRPLIPGPVGTQVAGWTVGTLGRALVEGADR